MPEEQNPTPAAAPAPEPAPTYISIDDFAKVEIKIGEIKSAERIEGSDKLLKLKVDFAEAQPRQVLSGIAGHFPDPAVLVGKKCPFVTNLKPRLMMGLESQAMIMAAGGDDQPLALFESTARVGSRVK